MNGLIKWLIIGALGLYVLSPVDLAPGLIDDAIMVLIYFVAARKNASKRVRYSNIELSEKDLLE